MEAVVIFWIILLINLTIHFKNEFMGLYTTTSDKVTDIIIYEGKNPYIFISYYHKDTNSIKEICNVLLEKVSICLLLLSKESAISIISLNPVRCVD